MNKHPDKYWRTREFYLAAYLFARGGTIVGVNADRRGVAFAFIDTLRLRGWFDEFRSGKPLFDARIYARAIDALHRMGFDALAEPYGEF